MNVVCGWWVYALNVLRAWWVLEGTGWVLDKVGDDDTGDDSYGDGDGDSDVDV